MTNQPLARKTDPATSHEAAEHIRPKLPHMHTRILMALNAHAGYFPQHPNPTASELIGSHPDLDGLWRRISEMHRLGLVVPCGVRKCRITGRKAQTWRVA